MGSEPIRFYLDFVSTYSYFAAMRIDAVASRHGRTVDSRIVSLPHVFKAAGTLSPLDQPHKLAHNRRDTERVALQMGLRFKRPPAPPDVQQARLVFHHLRARAAADAARFAREAMAVRFGEGMELTQAVLERVCSAAGVAADVLETGPADPAAKASLIATTQAAVEQDGMFGAPYAWVDGERFWGHDRIVQQLDWWLGRG